MRRPADLLKIYRTLFKALGPQHWWPGETPFEVIVGAVLTQNTAWSNVEKAIANLKRDNVLSLEKISCLPLGRLADLIRPAGYFNIKAARLKAVVSWLMKFCAGDLRKLARTDAAELRGALLGVYGVGEETADSILLYALNLPVFVVDTYTRRIFSRHGFLRGNEGAGEVKLMFESVIGLDERLLNEYHALIVRLGKDYCKTKPRCSVCPLKKDLEKVYA